VAVKLKGKNFNRSKALTNLVNKDKLTPHLIRASSEEFPWEYKYMPKEDDDAFHPSGHCTPSSEALYTMTHANEEDRAEQRKDSMSMFRTFQVGHFWHQYMQQLVLRLGFADEGAIEAKRWKVWDWNAPGEDPLPWHWATGSADVAPCSVPQFEDVVVDFKTMGNHDFKRKDLPDAYAAKYEAQLNIYMDWFDLETGLIVGIQKDTPHALKEYEFKRNQPLIDAVYEKWHYVSDCLRDGEAPDVKDKPLPLKGPVSRS
jgi:hypothetical protein